MFNTFEKKIKKDYIQSNSSDFGVILSNSLKCLDSMADINHNLSSCVGYNNTRQIKNTQKTGIYIFPICTIVGWILSLKKGKKES